MALTVTSRGTGTHGTGATTLVPGGRSATLAVGSLGVLCIALDNAGSAGAATCAPASWTDAKGNIWTEQLDALYDAGAASAGIEMAIYTAPITTALLTTDAGTITFSASPVAKAWAWYEVIPTTGYTAEYQTGASIAGATAANAAVATGSIAVGDAVIAGYFSENVAAVTGDSDTTNGTWTAQQTATVGSTTSGVRIATQQKVQTTAASTQTYNATVVSQDRIAGYIAIREALDVTSQPTAAGLTTSMGTPTVAVTANVTVVPGPAGGTGADYAATCAADSPVAAWRLGEASGNFVDATGSHTTTSVTGPPTYGVAGALTGDADTAVTFASAQYAAFAGGGNLPQGNAAWTMEAWVKTTTSGQMEVLGWGTASTNADTAMGLNAGGLWWMSHNATKNFGGAFADGAWHHLVVTYDGTTLTGYADGATVGTTYAPGTRAIGTGTGYIGLWSGYFVGTADEIRIYSTALSAALVAAHYTVGHDGPVAGGIVLTGAVPTVSIAAPANIVATPTEASLVATGAVPTVVALAPQVALPTAASLVATGATPAVATGVVAQPTAGALTATGATPAVLTPRVFQPTAASLTATGAVPAVTAIGTTHPIPTAASLVASGAAPTVVAIGTALSLPTAAALALAGGTPAVVTPRVALPTAGALTMAGATPGIGWTIVARPSAASLAITGSVPVVNAGAGLTVQPSAASMTLAGATPTVVAIGTALRLPSAATLMLTGATPNVAAIGTAVRVPGAASIALAGAVPNVQAGGGITALPTGASLTLAGATPTVTAIGTAHPIPAAAALTATGATPTVRAPVTLTPAAVALNLAFGTPIVSAIGSANVVPGPLGLTLTGAVPSVIIPALLPGLAARMRIASASAGLSIASAPGMSIASVSDAPVIKSARFIP